MFYLLKKFLNLFNIYLLKDLEMVSDAVVANFRNNRNIFSKYTYSQINNDASKVLHVLCRSWTSQKLPIYYLL